MAHGYVLHVGDTTITPQTTCNTEHKLWFKMGNDTWCVPMTTEYVTNALHVKYNNGVYSTCTNCDSGGGEWTIPETPEEPIVLPETCTWTQTNSDAYLYTEDGNQYFDTGVLINSQDNISVTMQVINGKHARIFGGINNSACEYDMTLNASGKVGFQIGRNGSGSTYIISNPSGKNTYSTKYVKAGTNNIGSWTNKEIYINGSKIGTKNTIYDCSASTTMLVLKNDYITGANPALSGGIKLYNIKIYAGTDINNQNPIHNFQPVAAGTNICGTTAATNAMWDSVTKKLYYPGGTGQMGYGVD